MSADGYLDRDGLRLRYRLDLAGPAAPWIVFGNSLMTDLTVWDDQAPVVRGRWNVLRYDQRGHGCSDVPAESLDIGTLAGDLLALLGHLAIDRATYVGLSMGVPTGLAACSEAPERFERLVLVDGQARSAPTGRAFWDERIAFARAEGMAALAEQTIARWLQPERRRAPAGDRLRRMIAATPLDGFTAAAAALRHYDRSAILSEIAVPVRLIAGAEDGAMPATMEAMAQNISGASFHVVPDAGHVPNLERPDAFNPILAAALA